MTKKKNDAAIAQERAHPKKPNNRAPRNCALGVVDAMLDAFDWEGVKRVMDALDWKYGGGKEAHRPTFAELRRTAQDLLVISARAKELPCSVQGGGFLVTCFTPGKFHLYFTTDSICDEDVEEPAKEIL